jgi:hypothetical protein
MYCRYRREIITVRGQSYFFVCPPPATKAVGTHSPGGEGDGGSIFWKTREIGLPSYSNNLSTADTYDFYSPPPPTLPNSSSLNM